MKCALILEKNAATQTHTEQVLRSLGYVVAATKTPYEALNVASCLDFDVIATYTPELPNDRRSLTSELKRYAPEAAVVLVADDEEPAPPPAEWHQGISAVIKRSQLMSMLWRIVQFGVDGCGLQPHYLPEGYERRQRMAV
jgi:CheY-like chemotaxis protein